MKALPAYLPDDLPLGGRGAGEGVAANDGSLQLLWNKSVCV